MVAKMNNMPLGINSHGQDLYSFYITQFPFMVLLFLFHFFHNHLADFNFLEKEFTSSFK